MPWAFNWSITQECFVPSDWFLQAPLLRFDPLCSVMSGSFLQNPCPVCVDPGDSGSRSKVLTRIPQQPLCFQTSIRSELLARKWTGRLGIQRHSGMRLGKCYTWDPLSVGPIFETLGSSLRMLHMQPLAIGGVSLSP